MAFLVMTNVSQSSHDYFAAQRKPEVKKKDKDE